MTDDEKIKFLKNYGYYKNRIRILNERKQAYSNSMYGIKAPTLSDMPHGGQAQGLDDKIVRALELTESIDAEIVELARKMGHIQTVINRLDNLMYKSVLEMRYIDGMTNDQTASILQLTVQCLIKWRKKAIKALPLEETDIERLERVEIGV